MMISGNTQLIIMFSSGGVLRRYLVGEGYLRVSRQQAVHQVVVGEDAGLVDRLLAVLIGGDEHDLLLGVLIGDLLHLAVFDHVEELVVADLRHCRCSREGKSSALSSIRISNVTT